MLLDLGVSSPQLDEAERGFSFQNDGPLDMRMDQTRGQSAADWVNTSAEDDIAYVLKEFGEERFAKRMARAIVAERQVRPFSRTKHLAEVIKEANPAWEKGRHPATRAFQAIRIYVNNELTDLDAVLEQALHVLAIGGRLVVISFHSLEDRIVKNIFREAEDMGKPVTRKVIVPTQEECDRNPRSRSAKLRIFQKGAQDEQRKYKTT